MSPSIPAGTGATVMGRNPVLPLPRRPLATVIPALISPLTAQITAGEDAERAQSIAPFTGDVLATLPQSTIADVLTAYRRARQAQQSWAELPVRRRAQVLLRFHDLLLRHQAEVLDLIQAETGKARLHAFEEIMAVAAAARHYGRTAPRYLRDRRRPGALPLLTHTLEARRPKGVIGHISPWNYPLELAVGDLLPAFAAGNAVVHKPDTQTALTALKARALLVAAGLPGELWQIVLGDGPVIGSAVIGHADYVSFTGSTATGRLVAHQAAERLVGASLELGGKNAMIVLPDANLDRAAAAAVRACFSSAGQLCVSIERLLLHHRIADAFLGRFLARTRALRLGTDLAYGADMGSLISQQHLHTVSRHVREAVGAGARVLAGGRQRPDVGPFFHEPTVLDHVVPGMPVYAEETFGPVVSVYRFGNDDEALALAHDTPYGLNASVFTRDARRGRALAARLRSGTVNINEAYAAAYGSVAAPMGGMNDSGLGRRHGREGIHRFTEAQTIATQRLLPMAPALGLDDAAYTAVLTTGLKALKTLRFR